MKIVLGILCGSERQAWLNPWLAQWLLAQTQPPAGIEIEAHFIIDRWPVSHARNVLVERAQSLNADWVVMLDNDNVPHSDFLSKILRADSHGIDVLALAYPLVKPGRMPIPSVGPAKPNDARDDNEFEEICEASAGCIAVRTSVFDRLERPYFRTDLDPEYATHDLGQVVGEDIGFCRAARATGVRVFIARGIACDHLKTISLLRVYERCPGP